MAKSLNKVMLIGNLTRDPELKFTPQGTAVCDIGLATNRQWTTDTGEKKVEADFHKLVAWGKLAELCGKYLKKGGKAYFEGRLQTRSWDDPSGAKRYATEVVVSDMILLDSRGGGSPDDSFDVPEGVLADVVAPIETKADAVVETSEPAEKAKGKKKNEEAVADDDIPF